MQIMRLILGIVSPFFTINMWHQHILSYQLLRQEKLAFNPRCIKIVMPIPMNDIIIIVQHNKTPETFTMQLISRYWKLYWLHWYYRYCGNKSLNFGTNLVLMQNSAWGLFFTTLIEHVYYFTDEKWYWMKGAFKRLLQTIKELYIYAIMVWWSLLKERNHQWMAATGLKHHHRRVEEGILHFR